MLFGASSILHAQQALGPNREDSTRAPGDYEGYGFLGVGVWADLGSGAYSAVEFPPFWGAYRHCIWGILKCSLRGAGRDFHVFDTFPLGFSEAVSSITMFFEVPVMLYPHHSREQAKTLSKSLGFLHGLFGRACHGPWVGSHRFA